MEQDSETLYLYPLIKKKKMSRRYELRGTHTERS